MISKTILLTLSLSCLVSADPIPNKFQLQPGTVAGTCPEKDPAVPVYFPDTDSCTIYYECSSGVAIPNVCPPGLEFSPSLHVCDFPWRAGCTAQENDKKLLNIKKTTPLSAVGTCPPRDTNVPVFLPDSEDCASYYLCSNGEAIKNTCAPGMAWNSKLNVCDWEIDVECPNSIKIENDKKLLNVKETTPLSAVGTCPPRDTNVPVFLPDSEDCTSYYLCSNGEAIKNTCAPGMAWNSKLNVCDWEIDVECPNSKKIANIKKLLIAKKITPLSAVGTCPPRDSNVPVFLPDSEDCTSYYLCSNGEAIKNICAPGMAWNSKLNVCDWEIDVECPNSRKIDIIKKTTNARKSTPLSAVGTCPPRDTNVPVFLPDSDDCTSYYLCSNGEAIKNTCAPGMAWNSKLNVCDWEIDVECSSSKKLVRTVAGTCPEKDPANPVFFPDTESCTIYYECSSGVAIPNVCPPGLEFSPSLHVCDFPWRAGCTIQKN